MSIILGEAEQVGNTVIIKAPIGGFNNVEAVRLTNFTNDVLIITDLVADHPGQEYLLPFQQNVYRQFNVRNPPKIVAIALGVGFSTDQVLVEWSTEAFDDFPGTYPVALTPSALTSGLAAPVFEVHHLDVLDDGTTYTIPGDTRRVSLSFFNNGPVDLRWSAFDSGWAGRPVFEIGGARTVDTQATVYFRVKTPTGGDGALQWVETRYGPGVIS